MKVANKMLKQSIALNSDAVNSVVNREICF